MDIKTKLRGKLEVKFFWSMNSFIRLDIKRTPSCIELYANNFIRKNNLEKSNGTLSPLVKYADIRTSQNEEPLLSNRNTSHTSNRLDSYYIWPFAPEKT